MVTAFLNFSGSVNFSAIWNWQSWAVAAAIFVKVFLPYKFFPDLCLDSHSIPHLSGVESPSFLTFIGLDVRKDCKVNVCFLYVSVRLYVFNTEMFHPYEEMYHLFGLRIIFTLCFLNCVG